MAKANYIQASHLWFSSSPITGGNQDGDNQCKSAANP